MDGNFITRRLPFFLQPMKVQERKAIVRDGRQTVAGGWDSKRRVTMTPTLAGRQARGRAS